MDRHFDQTNKFYLNKFRQELRIKPVRKVIICTQSYLLNKGQITWSLSWLRVLNAQHFTKTIEVKDGKLYNGNRYYNLDNYDCIITSTSKLFHILYFSNNYLKLMLVNSYFIDLYQVNKYKPFCDFVLFYDTVDYLDHLLSDIRNHIDSYLTMEHNGIQWT